uniref:4-coumarate--CoA ligase n=1 Tax=Leersia perrieri TaxID=77586 RepID=A0A0D9X212_9ORYZ
MDSHLAAGYCAATGIYRSTHLAAGAAITASSSFPDYILPRMLLPHLTARPAFIDAATGASLTFAGLRRLAILAARKLAAAAGLRRGHVVLLLSPNSIHFPALSLAVLSLGAILSPANPLLTPDELAAQALDSDPFLLLVSGDLSHKLNSIPDVNNRVVVLIEQLLLAAADGEKLDFDVIPAVEEGIGGDEAAMVFYSSGTTGTSKGVVSTHGNVIAAAAALERAWRGGGGGGVSGDGEVYGCVVPMCHMFGFACFVMGTAAMGETAVVVGGRFSPGKTMEAVEAYGVTTLLAVPPMIVKMARAAAASSPATATARRRRRLRHVVSSGAPLQREHVARFRRSFPDVKLGQAAGEIPMAYVVKKQGSSHLRKDEVISFVRSKVAPYKRIRKVVFVDSIPRSPSGKILRRQLKNLLQGSIQERSRM